MALQLHSSTPFCTGPELDGNLRFARGLMGASIGLAVLEVALEQGKGSIADANEHLGAVGGYGGARYTLKLARKAARGFDLRGRGLGGIDLGDETGAQICSRLAPYFTPDCTGLPPFIPVTICRTCKNPAPGQMEATYSSATDEAPDIISATIRFVTDSFTRINPILHPGQWFDAFKAYLRKWDITSNEGQAAMGAFLDLMPFFWPLGTLVKNMGRFVQCLKASACDSKQSSCRSRPGFFGCVADLLVSSIKDIITSPYFLLVVGVLTGNAIQTAQAGLRVVGTSIAQAMASNGAYAQYGGYVRMGFEVAADSTDIIRVCQSAGPDVRKNPAIYVMLGEMLVQRAGSTLPDVRAGGAFIRDHASILAKLATPDIAGAFVELKAKYVDTHIATVQGGIAKIQNASTLATWRGIASGLNSISAFFTKMSSEAAAGDNFVQRAGAAITKPVAALARTFREASASVTTITLTLERGMTVAQSYSWEQVVAEARALAERTGAALLADANAAVAQSEASAAQSTATAAASAAASQPDSQALAQAQYEAALAAARAQAAADAARAAANAYTSGGAGGAAPARTDIGLLALLGGGAVVSGLVIAKVARKRKSR